MDSVELYDDEFPLLKPLGLYAASTSADGNCLFNALSTQLYGSESHAHEIRTRVVSHLRTHIDYYLPFVSSDLNTRPKRAAKSRAAFPAAPTQAELVRAFENRLSLMANSGNYGDNLEVQGFANEHNMDVKIYNRENAYIVGAGGPSTAKGGRNDGEKRDIVHIAYHTWEHYSTIRNREGPHEGLPNVAEHRVDAVESRRARAKAKKVQILPWMENVVRSSLPYPEEPDKIRLVLTEVKGNVNDACERLISMWEEDQIENINPDKHVHESEEEEDWVLVTPVIEPTMEVVEIRPPPPSSPGKNSQASQDTSSSDLSLLGPDYDGACDNRRGKRQKSPDGTYIKVGTPPPEETRRRRSPRLKKTSGNTTSEESGAIDCVLSKKEKRREKRKLVRKDGTAEVEEGSETEKVTTGIRELYV